MLKTLGCVAVLVLSGSALLAAKTDVPDGYHAGLDGKQTRTVTVDGKNWSAWAYRNGDEFDIAVSFQDSEGRWSDPSFIGMDDGVSQVEPQLTTDGAGNLYLVYAELDTGRVLMVRKPRQHDWKSTAAVTPSGVEGRSPEAQVVGTKLVVAFRVRNMVSIVAVPLVPTRETGAVDDGPDPIGRPRK